MEKNCQNCKHLTIINKDPIYAACKKMHLCFWLWEKDTRASGTVCKKHEEK